MPRVSCYNKVTLVRVDRVCSTGKTVEMVDIKVFIGLENTSQPIHE